MSNKLLAIASALALSVTFGAAGAQAGESGYGGYDKGKSYGGYSSGKGATKINQNGNGCRNRCYGDQTFIAGNNNANHYSYGKGQGYGYAKGPAKINQNGNGCRNRCYGDQTFIAGNNNGNYSGGKKGK